jgi:hypothetical protein
MSTVPFIKQEESHVPTLQEERKANPNHILNRMEQALGDRRQGVVFHLGGNEYREFNECFQRCGSRPPGDRFLGIMVKRREQPGLEVKTIV